MLALGFLVKTRGGGVESGSRVCSLYGFTDEPIWEFPKKGVTPRKPTHGYLHKGKSLAEVEQILRDGVRDLREQALGRKGAATQRRNTALQKVERHATQSGALQPICATGTGALDVRSIPKVEQSAALRNRAVGRAGERSDSPGNATKPVLSLLQKVDTFAIARDPAFGDTPPAPHLNPSDEHTQVTGKSICGATTNAPSGARADSPRTRRKGGR